MVNDTVVALKDAGFNSLSDHFVKHRVELNRNMRRKIAETIRRVFKPRPRMTAVQCADTYRYIPQEASADFGRYRVGTYAIAYGPLLAVTEKGVQVITISASTQLMKTSFLECVILYFMVVDPSPMILLQPTKNLAKVFSTRKVDMMINHTPKARDVLIKATNAMKIFFGGDLMIVTAASENDLKMVPRRICMSDEVETIEDHEGGSAVSLAEARVESFGDRALCCRVSSPRLEDGPIEKSFRDGDMRLPFIECPACGHEQHMKWAINRGKPDERRLVRWDEDPSTGRWNPKTIRYHCANPECDHPFSERERQEAIQKVKYKQTRAFTCCDDKPELGGGYQRPEETRSWVDHYSEIDGRHVVAYATCQVCGKQAVPNEHASFGRASRLYSPKPLTKLVRLFKEALSSPSKMMTFVNNELAEPWVPENTIDWSIDGLAARLEECVNEVPDRVAALLAGVDVQETWIEVTVLGIGRANETWVIAHHRIVGSFDDFAVQRQLDEVLFKTYTGKNGRPFRIEQTMVDSGYKTTSVYRYTKAREGQNIFAAKGCNETGRNPKPVHPANPTIAGGIKAKLYMIGTISAKSDFFSFLSRTTPGPGFVHLIKNRVDEQYLQGLLAERKKKVPGGFIFECKEGARNEPLDTWYLAYAAAEGVRQRFKDPLIFDRWADELGIGRQMTEAEAARFNVDARKDIAKATREALEKNQKRKVAPVKPLAPPAAVGHAQPVEPAAPVALPDINPLQSAQSERLASVPKSASSPPSRFPQIARRSDTRGFRSPF